MALVAYSKIRVTENMRKFPGIEDLAKAKFEDLPQDEQDAIRALADTIEVQGLLHPPGVKDLGKDCGYRLIYGWRRYMAVGLLGKTTIDVRQIKGPSKNEPMAQLIENVHRKDPNPMEVAKHLDRVRAESGVTSMQGLAKLTQKSESWVEQRLSLLKADSYIQDQVASGEMGLSAARALMRLPLEEQPTAAKKAKREAKTAGKEKVTAKGARRQVRRSKDKQKDKQLPIRPVAERENEQKISVIREFYIETYGDKAIPKTVSFAVKAFWDYLFAKDRLYIKVD